MDSVQWSCKKSLFRYRTVLGQHAARKVGGKLPLRHGHHTRIGEAGEDMETCIAARANNTIMQTSREHEGEIMPPNQSSSELSKVYVPLRIGRDGCGKSYCLVTIARRDASAVRFQGVVQETSNELFEYDGGLLSRFRNSSGHS